MFRAITAITVGPKATAAWAAADSSRTTASHVNTTAEFPLCYHQADHTGILLVKVNYSSH